MAVAQDDEVPIMAWIVFIIACLVVIAMIPNDVWYMLLYVGTLLVVGFIGWLALIVALGG
jgi:hypothetical protein